MVGGEQNIKKVPLPVAYHLRQAVGALTLHTGRNYIFSAGQKKGQTGKGWRTTRRLSQLVSIANMGIFSEKTKRPRKKISAGVGL